MAKRITLPGPDLMTPREVAATCGVDTRTVTRWANAGKLPSTRTPGKHRRYRKTDVENLLNSAQHEGRSAA